MPIKETNPESSICCYKPDLAVDLHHILRRCYSELHEEEAQAGPEDQISSIRFEKPDRFDEGNEGTPQFNRMEVTSDIVAGLTTLHARTLRNDKESSVRDRLAISSGLKQLGLRDVSTLYLAGANNNDCFPSESDYKKVQNEWAEDSWRQLLEWNEVLAQNKRSLERPSNKSDLPIVSHHKPGFHVSFKHSLSSLLEEDSLGFKANLENARLSLLEEFRNNVGHSAPIVDINSYALKASSINQLEDLGVAFHDSNALSASSWVNKHSVSMDILSTMHKETKFSDVECAMASHEIFLKLLYRRFGEHPNDKIGKIISSRLWLLCAIARERERERPMVASSALGRRSALGK
jgi:hypothetical protein